MKSYFWFDSTIAIHWIKSSPNLLKTFVANRTVEIQEITNPKDWRHVPSLDNPADSLSRGQVPEEFINNRLWREAPSWLMKDETHSPNKTLHPEIIPDMKTNICLTSNTIDFDLLSRYSSYSKLLRIQSYCLRFLKSNPYRGALCIEEINETEMKIIKIIQAQTFAKEIKEIAKNDITNKNSLAALSPFIDNKGILRVGGRLQSSNIPFNKKHPILLPKTNFITDMIIHEIHLKTHHSGINNALYTLRNKFWILDGKNQIRKIIKSCKKCFRFAPSSINYKMRNLPPCRVNQARPFQNAGVDFCGPFYIKEKKFRNKGKIKVYICVFICMTIKAVHLEVVSEGFVGALRRFVARRGVPHNIYSDNGTNFVGAKNQMQEFYTLLNSDKHKKQIETLALSRGIKWHFSPPLAPHYGGLWESTVKIFKHHFKRVVGDLLFTFEELNTFTVEVEGILNSRLLTSLSSDQNDPLVLTPAHYLIGEPITSLPEREYASTPSNKLSVWQHIIKVRQDFWKRWNQEYLNELQVRHKWLTGDQTVQEGDMVLIKDKSTPCLHWKLGRVIKTHPGQDNIVRKVTIQTSTGSIDRSVKLLAPLPTMSDK